MIFWARSRYVPVTSALGLLLMIAAWAVKGQSLTLPTYFGGGASDTPLNTVIPIALAAVIAWSLSAAGVLDEVRSTRRIPLLDCAWALALQLIAVAALAVIGGDAWLLAPSVLFVCSATVALGAVAELTAAVGTTTSFLLLTSFYATDQPGARIVRFLHVGGDQAWAWGFASVAVLAMAASAFAPRRSRP